MNIIFAGTPELAGKLLDSLIHSPHHISHVYTQPDRPAGRGRCLTLSPVKTLALHHAIPILQPQTLKGAGEAPLLAQLAPDLLVVAAYGMILPPEILKIPRYGCINVHFSLLPRWRGASPVQQAILAGDEVTGISIIQMDAGLDTGDVISSKTCRIDPDETSEDLFARLIPIAQTLLLETIEAIEQGNSHSTPQDKALATIAPLIKKSEAAINWSKSALEIDRLIRAFYPWPVAYTHLGDHTLRIFKAEVLDKTTQDIPGLLLAATRKGLDIATGLGILRIKQVQLPGKKRTDVADLLNAHQQLLHPGMLLV